jgi:hypothetical protein
MPELQKSKSSGPTFLPRPKLISPEKKKKKKTNKSKYYDVAVAATL